VPGCFNKDPRFNRVKRHTLRIILLARNRFHSRKHRLGAIKIVILALELRAEA
jgi:hypothetical protein